MSTFELVGYRVMKDRIAYECRRMSDGGYLCALCNAPLDSYPNEGQECGCGARLLPHWKRVPPIWVPELGRHI